MKYNHKKTPLFDALLEFRDQKITPFDVPGHKRGVGNPKLTEYFGNNLMDIDVNSMKQLDNLSNPIGVIREAEELMADAYGSDYAFFLVNGTTSGVQTMIMSTCKPGDKIILPRNVHKSAVNALILSSAIPIYVQPETHPELGFCTGITVEALIEAMDENPDAKAVFVANPTYYGATSDLEQIIKIAHENGMAVLVDEAHGAHLPFSDELPPSAMMLGADIAAVSLHKTGGSLTQSSVLLLNEGFIEYSMVKRMLNLTQTTSASYLLMASLDVARSNLVINGKQRFKEILDLTREVREEINKIDGCYAFSKELLNNAGVYDFDETKLGINVAELGISGFDVYDILRKDYNIQMELADTHNVLGIVSIGDTKENLYKLVEALEDISKKHKKEKLMIQTLSLDNPQMVVTPRDAFYSHKKLVLIDEAIGEVSGESIMAYPPGIPIVTPGEKITKTMVEYIKFLKKHNSILNGTEDPNADYINILG